MKLLLSAIPLVFAVQLLHAAPVHMKLGNYEGVDAYGQECTVFLGIGMGGTYLDFFGISILRGLTTSRLEAIRNLRVEKSKAAAH